MRLKVLKDQLVEGTFALSNHIKVSSKRDEVCLELGHCVLSQTSSAKANSLAERANPRLRVVAMIEVLFIVGLETERAKLARAFVYFSL